MGLLLFSNVCVEAQVCSGSAAVGFDTIPGNIEAGINCVGLFRCHEPMVAGPQLEVLPAGCDPTAGACTIRAVVPLEFPGNHHNTTAINFFDSPVKLLWTDFGDAVVGACGNFGARIQVDKGEAWIERSFSCGASGGGEVYNLQTIVCDDVSDCEKSVDTAVDMTDGALTAAVCPPPPEKNDCDDCGCQASGGEGGGAAPPSGGGASAGGMSTGPGAFWFYKAGGIGRPTHPGSNDWDHGRYWSHSYARRIVEDPEDAAVAHLVTERAVYRTFTDNNADGTYDEVEPASEYRTLVKTASGWTLTDLDGTVDTFRADGRWTGTTDRYGNAKTATYSGNELTSVSMPDGRRDDFTYVSGKVATLIEVGVDGVTPRTWTYTWSGDDLTRVDRPDGTALIYAYGDGAHPGYLTRITLQGADGVSERVTAAFEYDARGNVIKMWRGASDFASGVDRWEFTFDDPVLPTATTVTDPLGNTFTRSWADRDFVTDKARLVSVDGDCPTCGVGPNSTLLYEDALNPFKPTREVDGKGNVTLMSYDAQGRMTSRTEAFGTAVERTTTWSYDGTYPSLVARIERPSTTGDPLDLRTVDFTRDAQGNVTTETHQGVESGAAFSFDTVRTYSAQGRLLTVDPPGHGTDDLVTYVYDGARGGLILDERIDPIVGTTDFGYDAFNRQVSVVDPNGVETMTEYDAMDRVTFLRRKGASLAEDLVTETRYDAFGDAFQTVLPEGNVVEYGYDDAGRLISVERKADDAPTTRGERTVYTLDGVGRRVLEVHERWESGAWVEHSRSASTYATRCYLDSVTVGSGGEESTTEYAYDCNGNLERIWDANHPSAGQTTPPSTVYAYDALDRLVEVRQPFGGAGGGDVITSYGYDVQDHLVTLTDGEGTVTSYAYSDRDLLMSESSEVSGITASTYDEAGNMTTRTDARGIAETRTYDDLDRPLTVDYPGTAFDIVYTYEDGMVPFSTGRLTKIERNGHAVDYGHDRFGRLIQDGDLTLGYDKNGNRVSLGYPGGIVSTYTFDYADREGTLSIDTGGGGENVVTAASYLPSGPLAGLTLGNGFMETRGFDSRYHPASIELDDGGAPVLSWTYTTDAVGNPTSIVDILNAVNNRTYGYQDFQYFLTQGNGPWGTLAWTYDKIGNRLSESRDGTAADTYAYTLNAAMGRSPKLASIALGAGGVHSFNYDAVGNQAQSDAVTRTYDAAGRMSRQDRPSSEAVTDFEYDGRGFLRRSVGIRPSPSGIFCDGFESGDTSGWGGAGSTCLETLTTEPLYDSGGLLHHNGDTAVLYFAGRPVAQVGASLAYLTTDHLGTPIALSSSSMVWSGGFEPFGTDYASATGSGVFLRLPGQWDDASWTTSGTDSEVFYNVWRWYGASTGRYGRVDPVRRVRRTFEQGWLLVQGEPPYTYARSSPLFYFDPAGLLSKRSRCVTRWTAAGATAGAVVGSSVGAAGGAAACTPAAPGVGTLGCGVSGGASGLTAGAAAGGAVGAFLGSMVCPDDCDVDVAKRKRPPGTHEHCLRLYEICVLTPSRHKFNQGKRCQDCFGMCRREGVWPFELCRLNYYAHGN